MCADTYYQRKRNDDGSFGNAFDKEIERSVRKIVELYWGVRVYEYPKFNPVDWFFEKDGRIAGYGEFKYRRHSVFKFDTVYLSMRKCDSLFRYGLLSDVPSFYIVKFEDEIRSIDIMSMNRNNIILGGCKKNMKSVADSYEPIIVVDIDHMTKIDPT